MAYGSMWKCWYCGYAGTSSYCTGINCPNSFSQRNQITYTHFKEITCLS